MFYNYIAMHSAKYANTKISVKFLRSPTTQVWMLPFYSSTRPDDEGYTQVCAA